MKKRSNRGFSLVCCLLLLLLLCAGVTGFLSSTGLHRSAARQSLAKSVARSAAESAAAQAASLLAEKIAAAPDSATGWQRIRTPGTEDFYFEGTVLHLHPQASGAGPLVLPLVSRPDSSGDLLEEIPAASGVQCLGMEPWTSANSVNLNRPLFRGDQQGWIGSPETSVQRPHPFRARWIGLRSPQGAPPPPVSARYAFWMEDESFRLHLNRIQRMPDNGTATAFKPPTMERGPEAHSPGIGPEEIPMLGLLAGMRGIRPNDRGPLAVELLTLRNAFPSGTIPEIRAFNYARSGRDQVLVGDGLRFLGTLSSSALNLSRHGTQRVNLNAALGLEEKEMDWKLYAPPTAVLQRQHRRLVETIRFHAPRFGQRFYRTTSDLDRESVTSAHQEVYLNKIAANIQDLIDPDLQPTLVDSAGHIVPPGRPEAPLNADAPDGHWAQGKDSTPCLQEAVVRLRSEASSSRYKLRVDYYLEFWNPTDRDIYVCVQPSLNEPHSVGPETFVKVSNQPAWISTPSGTPLRSTRPGGQAPVQAPARDIVIDLCSGVYAQGKPVPGGVCFRAGHATVITTDPDYLKPPEQKKLSPGFSGGYNLENIYFCSKLLKGTREYEGPIGPRGTAGIKPDFRDNTEDYDTEVLLGNLRGLLDSHPAAVAMGGGARVTRPGQSRDDWYGGSLLGNGITPSQTGDPRTNNEALRYTRFLPGASTTQPDQGRYFNTVSAPRFSLGHPNDTHTNPHLQHPWPDPYKGWNRTSTGTAKNPRIAPARVANGWTGADGRFRTGIPSIGLLGDVFDPARKSGTRGSLGIEGSRGGGRTLRIGQPDDLVRGSEPRAASREWAAWRLVDFFATRSQIELPGVLNLNGISRDNGFALRALCHGLSLNLEAQASRALEPTTGIRPLATQLPLDHAGPGLHRIIRDAIELLGSRGPYTGCFRERGEWSELPAFAADSETLFQGTRTSIVFDHAREEFFRRTVELLTTRGNVFTVYCVGQAIVPPKSPEASIQILAEHWLKTTFALLPRKADGSPFGFATEDFNPDSPESVARRFTAPDYYDIRSLARSEP